MSISEALNTYKDSLQVCRTSIVEADLALARDGGSGVSATKTSTMGFVNQPVVQFTAGSKFACRSANFDINANTILHQSQNLYQTTNSRTLIADFDVSNVSRLISTQTAEYQRLVSNQDFAYSEVYKRYSSDSFAAANYFLLQVDSSSKQLDGPAGRLELNAFESLNLNSQSGYLVGRAAKKIYFESKDFEVKASGTISMQAGLAASLSATTSLSLSGKASASLTSTGTTSVSSSGPVVVTGSIVQINGGAAGLVKNVIDTDAVQQAAGLVMSSTPENILAAITSGFDVASVVTPILSNPYVSKVTEAAFDIASGTFDPLEYSGDFATQEIQKLTSDLTTSTALSPELSRLMAGSAVANGSQDAVRQVISSSLSAKASSLGSYGVVGVPGRGQASTLNGLAGEGILDEELLDDYEDLDLLLDGDIASLGGELPPPPAKRTIPAYTPARPLPKTSVLDSGLPSSTPRP